MGTYGEIISAGLERIAKERRGMISAGIIPCEIKRAEISHRPGYVPSKSVRKYRTSFSRESYPLGRLLSALTPMEKKVLAGIGRGKSNTGIAHNLGCAVATIGTHRTNLVRKILTAFPRFRNTIGSLTRLSIAMGIVEVRPIVGSGGAKLTPTLGLTHQEFEILKHLGNGLSLKEMACQIGTTQHIVDANKRSFFKKIKGRAVTMDLDKEIPVTVNTVEIVHLCELEGLIPPLDLDKWT